VKRGPRAALVKKELAVSQASLGQTVFLANQDSGSLGSRDHLACGALEECLDAQASEEQQARLGPLVSLDRLVEMGLREQTAFPVPLAQTDRQGMTELLGPRVLLGDKALQVLPE